MTSPSPASSALVEHISAHSGSLPSASRLAPYFSYSSLEPSASGPPAQKVHLSILPREPKLPTFGILRPAERAGVEAVATADAEVLGVQHHGVCRGVEAVHRADRGAGRI